MISPIDIIGSLVYKTREALNKNNDFLEKIKHYEYYPLISDNGKMQLWHYPGTPEEISDRFMQMQDIDTSFLKYPAVFNYQNVLEQFGIKQGINEVFFNLAFVAPTCRDWGTETRKDKVFKTVLYDIYHEFLNQIRRCKFILTQNEIIHRKYDVYTTGKSQTQILEFRYADYMDAIQIINLRLQIRADICDSDIEMIEVESKKVFDNNLKL